MVPSRCSALLPPVRFWGVPPWGAGASPLVSGRRAGSAAVGDRGCMWPWPVMEPGPASSTRILTGAFPTATSVATTETTQSAAAATHSRGSLQPDRRSSERIIFIASLCFGCKPGRLPFVHRPVGNAFRYTDAPYRNDLVPCPTRCAPLSLDRHNSAHAAIAAQRSSQTQRFGRSRSELTD